MHLSRLGRGVVLWATAEFGFVELARRLRTGSSIMPQKKNPDVAELVRGKTGRVFGDLVALLTVMKGLPLAYNRDLQEDKEAFFDAADTVRAVPRHPGRRSCARCEFRPERLRAVAGESYSTATDLADYLVRKGVPFRNAHELVGKAVALALGRGVALPDVPLEALRGLSPLFEADFRDAVTVDASLAARNVYGGTGPKAVEQELAEARALLEEAV